MSDPSAPAIDLSEPEPPEAWATMADVDPAEPPLAAPDATGPVAAEAEDTGPKAGTPPLAPVGEQSAPPVPPPLTGHGGPTPAEPPAAPARVAPWKPILVVVAILSLGVAVYPLIKGGGTKKTPAATATTTTTVAVNTAGWATFADKEAGFTIKHPKDWQPLATQGAERLLLRVGSETAAQITVRNIDSSAAPDVIQQVMADAKLRAQPVAFKVNGLAAVVYIYDTPITQQSPDPGVVVHYFVLSPAKLYQLVFVTRPPEELNRLGRIFSTVALSFQSTSDTPAPEPSTTPSTAGTPTTTG